MSACSSATARWARCCTPSGVFINKSFDAMNLTQAALVEAVHQEYVRAGADILETNTFGANRIKLASFGLADKLHDINVAGAAIARRAAGDRAMSRAPIGPLGIRIEPWGKTGVDEAREYFREQAQALVEGGVDLFILETFRDLNEIGAAIDAVRSRVGPADRRADDHRGRRQHARRHAARAFRARTRKARRDDHRRELRRRPGPMLETIERMEAVTPLKLSAQPNAGKPRDVEGRNIYLCSPEYMASYARRFVLHNVRVVGGCCGTTPEHIRQIKAAVRGAHPQAEPASPRNSVKVAAIVAPPVPREKKSRLAHELARGTFVLGVELLPPRGFESEPAIQRARELKRYGVDVVNIPDGLRSGARVSALALALLWNSRPGSKRSCTTRVAIATCSASSRICWVRTPLACGTCCL